MIYDRNYFDRQFIYHLSILIDNRWEHYTTLYNYMKDNERYSMIPSTDFLRSTWDLYIP